MLLPSVLPCSYHVLAMLLPWFCHALASVLPCSCHALAMLLPCFLPCFCHDLATIMPCSCHAPVTFLPCSCHVPVTILPCSRRVLSVWNSFLSTPFFYNIKNRTQPPTPPGRPRAGASVPHTTDWGSLTPPCGLGIRCVRPMDFEELCYDPALWLGWAWVLTYAWPVPGSRAPGGRCDRRKTSAQLRFARTPQSRCAS